MPYCNKCGGEWGNGRHCGCKSSQSRGGNSKRRYAEDGYPHQYRGGGNQRPKKHSGCRMTQKPGMKFPIIYGWMVKGKALIALYATEYAKTKEHDSKTGKRWANLFVRLTNKSTMQVTKTSGLLNLDNNKLYIKELNLVANPKAPNGGYFGVQIKSRYNN